MQRQFQYPSRDINAVSSEDDAAMKCRTGFDRATTKKNKSLVSRI